MRYFQFTRIVVLPFTWTCLCSVSPTHPKSADPNLQKFYSAYERDGCDGILDQIMYLSDKEQNVLAARVSDGGWETASQYLTPPALNRFKLELMRCKYTKDTFPNRFEVWNIAHTIAFRKYPFLRPYMK
jgi:hypothetical protein